jgi:hypothetical protein
MRTSNGCWTCRLRRKKCDEVQPICDTCAALSITCHFDQDAKPDWMDGGLRQEEMAEHIKREVKEKAHQRRGERMADTSGGNTSVSQASTSESPPMNTPSPLSGLFETSREQGNDEMEVSINASIQLGPDCKFNKDTSGTRSFTRCDTVYFMFYLERLHPFFFPFYNPSLLEGGKSWILELMLSSPVIRQATICQSSHFFSIVKGLSKDNIASILTKSTEFFGLLRHALQVIDSSGIADHLHGAVRVMASIIQVQRYDISVLTFHNWHAHLNAAVVLFRQILNCAKEPGRAKSNFDNIWSRLGPPTCGLPSAEQCAYLFSSTILMYDSIIASTVLQEQPKLYDYHCGLLGTGPDGTDTPPINLESVLGFKNWTIAYVGEISTLDAWKRRCKSAESLDIMELARRATVIKNALVSHLTELDTDSAVDSNQDTPLFEFVAPTTSQSHLVTRVWAHGALLYLSIVVSGWQPANADVRYLVNETLELLRHQSSPALLRTMVWPFCVAGCLAEPMQEFQFRELVQELQPPSIFATAYKALEIMENVWQNRDVADRDLAMCFRFQDDLVLLV